MSWFVIHPSSRAKMVWDAYAMLILLYTIVIAPLRIGFDIGDVCPSAIWLWEFIIDLSFIIDLFLNFVTAVHVYNNGYEELRVDLKSIARHYLSSWFLVDFVSSLPIDMILSLAFDGCNGHTFEDQAGSGSTNSGFGILRLIRILRLVKLLKIVRVLRLHQVCVALFAHHEHATAAPKP